jgi:hypothetical protein
MAIRIDRIKVNRGGPLENDFQLEPGDVNLIYGYNETGKSYVVEAIINLLFRTGRKSTVGWNLRDWYFAGSIIVSGLGDKSVTFKGTGKKLEDYWDEETGLPRDLSRLLVVKEGATLLAEEKDGVGRNILKNYLSGEGLLDRIQEGISNTLQQTSVKNGQIIGPARGERKTREQLLNNLKELGSLLKKAENAYTSGVIYDFQQKQNDITNEIEGLEKAKRYHAYRLQTRIDSLNREKKRLPSEKDLSMLESKISIYEETGKRVSDKSEALTKLETAEQDYKWAKNALEKYEKWTSGQIVSAPKPIYIVLAFVFLIGTVVTGFFNLPIPLAISAAGALTFSVFYVKGMRRALASAGTNKELDGLKKELGNRYGSDDIVTLKTQLDKLQEENFQAKSLKKELEEELLPNLKVQEAGIRIEFKKYKDKDIPSQNWRSTIKELRSELIGLTDKINSLDKELTSLAVPEKELLPQDPGIEWDAERYKVLKGESSEISETLDAELGKLETLKARIAQETRSDSTDWEELVSALSDLREKTADECRGVTAEILAKIQVNAVIQELRKEENARIASGLEGPELTEPLHAITGCYKCMRYDEDDGLIVINDEDEEYPLEKVSSGAQEQAFLAMRMGFSSIAMKGQTAFLILDDAFQHSDWLRRENLMGQVLRLVGSGWQVFYFTMDDHIRDLFLKVGEKVGSRFKSLELR